jgi:hypothetical protein
MTHPVWWPISAAALERVVLQKAVIFTVFNPAHLFEALEAAGFQVTTDFPKKFSAQKKVGSASMTLEGMTHYFEMIQHYFFSEEDVVGMLREIEREIPSVPSRGAGKIEMYFEQRFGRPDIAVDEA